MSNFNWEEFEAQAALEYVKLMTADFMIRHHIHATEWWSKDEFTKECADIAHELVRHVRGNIQVEKIQADEVRPLKMEVYDSRVFDDSLIGLEYKLDRLHFNRYCTVAEAKKAIIAEYGVKSNFVEVTGSGHEVYRAKVYQHKESGDITVHIDTL